jgi:acyl carrier protein
MTEQITEALETLVRQAGQVAADDPLFSRDVDLIETGYLDSVGVVALLTYLETSFLVTVDDDTWAALDPLTINGISALISR